MTEVHFIRDERTWRVYDSGAPEPISEHTNATEAELAAEDRDTQRVVIHDRYHRTHDAARPRHPLMTSGSASPAVGRRDAASFRRLKPRPIALDRPMVAADTGDGGGASLWFAP